MTVQQLKEWLANTEARGVSPDSEIMIDASSEDHNVTFRCQLDGPTIEYAHDEDDTPYVVLQVSDIESAE